MFGPVGRSVGKFEFVCATNANRAKMKAGHCRCMLRNRNLQMVEAQTERGSGGATNMAKSRVKHTIQFEWALFNRTKKHILFAFASFYFILSKDHF